MATRLNWDEPLAIMDHFKVCGFAFVEFEACWDAADADQEPDKECCVAVVVRMEKKKSKSWPTSLLGRRPRDDYPRSPPRSRSPRRGLSRSRSRSPSRDKRYHCLGREITNHPDPSLGPLALLDQLKENRDSLEEKWDTGDEFI